jgi:hypothetical protein
VRQLLGRCNLVACNGGTEFLSPTFRGAVAREGHNPIWGLVADVVGERLDTAGSRLLKKPSQAATRIRLGDPSCTPQLLADVVEAPRASCRLARNNETAILHRSCANHTAALRDPPKLRNGTRRIAKRLEHRVAKKRRRTPRLEKAAVDRRPRRTRNFLVRMRPRSGAQLQGYPLRGPHRRLDRPALLPASPRAMVPVTQPQSSTTMSDRRCGRKKLAYMFALRALIADSIQRLPCPFSTATDRPRWIVIVIGIAAFNQALRLQRPHHRADGDRRRRRRRQSCRSPRSVGAGRALSGCCLD